MGIHHSERICFVVLLIAWLMIGCTTASVIKNGTSAAPSSTITVAPGDLVQIQAAVYLPNGEVAFEAGRLNAQAPPDHRSVYYSFWDSGKQPLKVVAGKASLFPGLGKVVIGGAPGQKMHATLQPEDLFGQRDPSLIQTYPRIKSLPDPIIVTEAECRRHLKRVPGPGDTVHWVPFFKSRVIEARGGQLVLAAQPDFPAEVSSPFGTTHIAKKDGEILITLEPNLGAPFRSGDKFGRISLTSPETFTVDFNHPLAGQSMALSVTIERVVKAAEFEGIELDWHEDPEAGLNLAREKGQPSVMVLYADWCDWCKKLFRESLQDLRIKDMRNAFVWIKTNSDLKPEYKLFYDQKKYPTILVFDANGNVLEKFEGFVEAEKLYSELLLCTGKQ